MNRRGLLPWEAAMARHSFFAWVALALIMPTSAADRFAREDDMWIIDNPSDFDWWDDA